MRWSWTHLRLGHLCLGLASDKLADMGQRLNLCLKSLVQCTSLLSLISFSLNMLGISTVI